jgi:hypothetical protein
MVATGASVTVTLAVPGTPSLVAVIVEVPGPTAVTTPLLETVTAAVLLDVHDTTRPVSTFPLASLSVAVSGAVRPTVRLVLGGVTVTVATGTGITVTNDVPVCPSLVAVIVALPGDTAVTTPVAVMVATAVLFELHVTTRPVSTFPLASFSVTASGVV